MTGKWHKVAHLPRFASGAHHRIDPAEKSIKNQNIQKGIYGSYLVPDKVLHPRNRTFREEI